MDKDSQKRYLYDYSKEELSKLSVNQVQQLYIETLKAIAELSESVTRTINKLNEYRKKAEQSGDGKTASELGRAIDSAKSQLYDKLSRCCEIVEDIKTEDAKTLSLFNQSDKDRERAFVETMSSSARTHEEYIQARRDARYEEMIQEAGEIYTPANKLRH